MSHSFIVPLGPNIHMRRQMEVKYNPEREYLFFDLLDISFPSVLDVMNSDDIRTIINKETFTIRGANRARVTISFKGTDRIHNYVDIRPTSARADTREFFPRMYHRYERLMVYVKQDSYPLTFTFAGRIEDAQATEFMNAVRAKNAGCKFRLVSLDGEEDELETSVPRFSRIRFTKIRETEEENKWKMDHYDWAHVWATIDALDKQDMDVKSVSEISTVAGYVVDTVSDDSTPEKDRVRTVDISGKYD